MKYLTGIYDYLYDFLPENNNTFSLQEVTMVANIYAVLSASIQTRVNGWLYDQCRADVVDTV